MTLHYEFDAERFDWAMRGVGADEVRFYLKGVRVEPREGGGALMVATNGHVMFVAEDPSAECPEAATFSVAMVEDGPGAGDVCDCCGGLDLSRDLTGVRLRFDAPEAAGGHALASFVAAKGWGHRAARHPLFLGVVERVGGEFPDWRKAFNRPEERQPGLPVLGPALIARAAFNGGGVLIVPRGRGWHVPSGGGPMKCEPSIIIPVGAPWGFVVAMPMGVRPDETLPADALARAFIAAEDLAAVKP